MEDSIEVQHSGDETERHLQTFVKACHDLISLSRDQPATPADAQAGIARDATVSGLTAALKHPRRVELVAKDTELAALVEQYRAGLEAELMLLHRLYALAIEQRSAAQIGEEFQCIIDRRSRIMTTLETVEHELKAVREHLAADRERLIELPAFHELVARHTEASDLIADTLAVDRDSLDALNDTEEARTSPR